MFILGIIAESDAQKGIMIPSYILCRDKSPSTTRSGYRIRTGDAITDGVPRVIFPDIDGYDRFIDFMSFYRTRDHMHNSENYSHEDTKKYYPKGLLAWCKCDKYGTPLGSIVPIKWVPDKSMKCKNDTGHKFITEYHEPDCSLADILKNDTWTTTIQ